MKPAVEIIQQPVSQEVPVGTAVSFDLNASGKDLKYQWYYRTSENDPWICAEGLSATTESLSITWNNMTVSKNGWQFYCYVWNQFGSVSSDIVTLKVIVPGWKKNSKGWWYQNTDGTYPKNTWQKIADKWYHFDSSGYMQTGWIKLGKIWYYLGTSGAMQTGWQQIGNAWYYFNTSGAMLSGWQQISSKWYYFSASGAMQTGWRTVSGKTYYFKENGQMAAKEWCKGYWLNADGTWTYKYKASWKQNSKGWWYGDESGWYAKNCTVKIDGKTYTFDSRGYLT